MDSVSNMYRILHVAESNSVNMICSIYGNNMAL